MWYTGTPLFPFGWGLSYTSFSLSWSGATPQPATVSLADGAVGLTDVTFAVEVVNTGKVAGKETVMAFWAPPKDVDPLLNRQLFDFQVRSKLNCIGDSSPRRSALLV
jgi:beta-D-xylosidase 4